MSNKTVWVIVVILVLVGLYYWMQPSSVAPAASDVPATAPAAAAVDATAPATDAPAADASAPAPAN